MKAMYKWIWLIPIISFLLWGALRLVTPPAFQHAVVLQPIEDSKAPTSILDSGGTRSVWQHFRMPEQLPCSRDCALYSRYILESYEVYVGRDKIFADGNMADPVFDGFSLNLIELDRPVLAGETVSIRMSAGGPTLGMESPLWLGERTEIAIGLFKRDWIPSFLAVQLILLSAVVLMQYLLRLAKRYLLFFSLFLLSGGGYYLGMMQINLFFYDDPSFWIRVANISLYMLPVSFGWFMESVMPETRKVARFVWVVHLAYLSAAVAFDRITSMLWIYGLDALLFVNILTFSIAVLRLGEATKEKRILGAGLLVYLGTGVIDLFLYEWTKIPYSISQYGLAIFVLCLFQIHIRRVDLTQRSLASHSEELRRKNEELMDLGRIKDDYLAATSHELRTPLHGIIGMAQSLLDGAEGPIGASARRNLEVVVASGKRLSGLVNETLDFHDIGNRRVELERKPLTLRPVVEAVLTALRPLVGERDIELRCKVHGSIEVDADESRLQQILYNLAGNAVKFTVRGAIDISARSVGGFIEIVVEDSGVGIEPDRLSSIFEPFIQGSRTVGGSNRGTGLGLPIAKRLVELHGGTIEVTSEVGQGTAFKLTLPAALNPTKQVRVQAEPGSQSPSLPLLPSADSWRETEPFPPIRPDSEVQILAVDDDPVNLEVVVQYLSAASWGITAVTNGCAALEIVHARRVDLILLDVHMQDMSGFEVCERLRETYSAGQLPVIMLTAQGSANDIARGFQAGASDYLTKPFSRYELLARIEARLKLRLLDRERQSAKLTPTEKLILEVYGSNPGCTRRTVLELLNREREHPMTAKTLENHITNALRKLETGTMAEAVHTAKMQGWI